MSFVDVMANDVWTETDIVRRTESMVRSEFSFDAENILNRKATGAALGHYELTPEDLMELADYAQVVEDARVQGALARADMALLSQVMAMEVAAKRLAQPEVTPELDEEGNVLNQDAVDADAAERAQAQAVMDAASPEALALYEARKPAPEPTPEPEPTPDPQPETEQQPEDA